VLNVTQLRQYVTSALEDAALQGLLTAAYEAIDPRLPSGAQTETITCEGDLLMLSIPAASITSIADRRYDFSDYIDLASDDYERESSTMLRRLRHGTHPDWRWHRPKVIYLPIPAEAERDRMAIALVKLDLTYQPALQRLRIGEYEEQYAAAAGLPGTGYADLREAILSSYSAGDGAFA
jgi:hypothetical protein